MLLAMLFAAKPAAARTLDRWNGHIAEASARFGVPEVWIRRVIIAESGGRTLAGGRPIVSRAGAMGLMQLMPRTWEEMRLRHRLGPDPHDPRDNILAGTAYLRAMHDRFGYPGLFAAYNAGPRRYVQHLRTGSPLPSETISYMAQLASRTGPPDRRRGTANAAAPAGQIPPTIFAVRLESRAIAEPPSPALDTRLFAIPASRSRRTIIDEEDSCVQ